MAFLLDTCILPPLTDATDPLFAVVDTALARLRSRHEVLHLTPQNLIEFRNVATRPKAANGLGKTPAEAELLAAQFEVMFPLLADSPDIYPNWKSIVSAAGVIGKQVHDARLVAACVSHGVTDLLTFNLRNFTRIAAAVPTVRVIDPATV